ncbi:Protein of unknown function [Fibrobacter sp. UWB16]|uniref:DUF3990 domain-containing protein n=1 Tax=unclassified Fibrobacter TaxID=2634177 RepID=UPI000B525392|nr:MULTISPECIES: DUF3990 domain-containing protein [unclassified Fibrobacter]OWV19078.1 hypothetical protein B7991_09380 [Fibrobacter sp. UWB3]SOD12693.1 Protein of unknown function [Fibrobacter sp. UWB16]
MILYHGSNCDIEKIDLAMCKPFKDFGQSFYLTTILVQAREMSQKVADRFGGKPVVNAFEFDDSDLSSLKIKNFGQPDREWAEFVMANRSRNQKHPAEEFDLIIGPVANDDIATLFRTFAINVISIDELVNGLKSRRLNNQYAFRTPKAISFLQKRPSV